MSEIWRDIIKDSDEVKVFEALSDIKWDFRTVEGIARESGLSPDRVQDILSRRRDLIELSSLPDRRGRSLYALKESKKGSKAAFEKLRMIVSKSMD